ncbi:MAG: endolytic transglycosylase MltG [Oscillospiraceae bacterium]|nr:endolytic transglycosylase MltG [Oscillospiraceae bacterium]
MDEELKTEGTKIPETDNNQQEEQTVFSDDFIIGKNFSIDEEDSLTEADLVSQYSEENDTSDTKDDKCKGKKAKKKGCVGALFLIIAIFVASVSLAAVIVLMCIDYLGIGNSGTYEVEIPKGSATSQIAEKLKDQGVIKSDILFRIYSKLKGYDGTYKYGVYIFSGDTGYDDIIIKLQDEGEQADSVEVMIPECATIDEIAVILEEKGVCTKSEFIDAVQHSDFNYDFIAEIPSTQVYYRLEGYLYPDTYELYNYGGKTCAEFAIEKMLTNFDQKVTGQMRDKATEMGHSLHEIMTMASIIDLEASSGTGVDKQNVSAVFYNRLAWTEEPNLLGSTPTSAYPYGSGRYDTNKSTGLPPGPLCAPSYDSIYAALYPTADFTASYFVTDSDMAFYYNDTYDQHLAIIRKLKQQGKWVG